ncbi:MAG: DsrE family protein [Bacteroidales bacterium]|nr:DsrE family protein [Bacteroidales bacterium]
MKKQILPYLFSIIFFPILSTYAFATSPDYIQSKDTTKVCNKDKLVVLWTSTDREVALKMVFMYTYNANNYQWWDEITLLVWGPSQKLLTEDKELQEYVKKMIDYGIEVLACKGCADQYEISDELEKIGVIVRYTGVDLTNFIKERHVITF